MLDIVKSGFNGNGAKPTLAEHAAEIRKLGQKPASSWRDVLPIHPAAELFPRLSPDELKTLGEDIKANGLQVPIVVRVEKLGDEWIYQLLDGRNRLDAIELVGFGRAEIPHVATRTDSKGRQQPAKKATAERNRKARERRADARAQKREDELKAHAAEEAKAAAKAAQLAADLMKANLAQRVLAWLRWQEGDPRLLQDALSDLNVYNDPTPEASAAAMKAKFAAADDGLDIPACLRRAVPTRFVA